MSTAQRANAIELTRLILNLDETGLQDKIATPEGLSPLINELAQKSPGAFFSELEELARETRHIYISSSDMKKAAPPRRLGMLLSLARRNLDEGKGRASVANLLIDNGAQLPSGEEAYDLKHIAIQLGEIEMILWMGERGLLGPQTAPMPGRYEHAICNVFQKEGERELQALERLVECGVFKDGDGFVGFTDFMAHHQFKSAQLLSSLGFAPRLQVLGRRFNSPGMSAVASYARLVNEMDSRSPEAEAQTIEQVKRDLNFLAAIGAPFAFDGPGCEDPNLDPFASSVYNRTASVKVSQAFYQELLRHGANPNQSGLWLANEAQALGFWRSTDETLIETALAAGADPTQNPGRLFSGLSSFSKDSVLKAKWLKKFQALGADLKAVPQTCAEHEHPLACGITRTRWSSFEFAELLLQGGLRPDWISSNDGATLLHYLAEASSKPALAFTQRLLSEPSVKALINHPRAANSGAAGVTALMEAAGALNAEQIKILLKAGADPNLRDAQGRSALHHAGRKFGAKAQKKCAAIISLLIEGGADPALTNAKGLTAGQAMAKRAPLEGLAALLELRPEDLGGSSPEAKQAQEKLMARGGRAISLVESAVINGELRSKDSSEPAAQAPKTNRSRL